MSPAFGLLKGQTLPPVQDLDILAEWGVELLTNLVAKDSQSDEDSPTIPSTDGQRELSKYLAAFFDRLMLKVETDDYANLIVRLPPNPEDLSAPIIALIAHLDTAKGTQAVRRLSETPAWQGTEVFYPGNEELAVTVDDYADTEPFLREDLVHGPGTAPIGLDDKLGIAELMILTRVLLTNPEITHGELRLVFRPDEEIGRMAAVEGLADTLAQHGVRYGYTVDGIAPFEVNVENFSAARARVHLPGDALETPSAAAARRTVLRITGVKSYGATAKAEGYRNATMIFAGAMKALGEREDVVPVDFQSDPAREVDAEVAFRLFGSGEEALDAAEADVIAALEGEIAPHRARGARLTVVRRRSVPVGTKLTNEAGRLAKHLQAFLDAPGPTPLLSEVSEGYEGYSNPYMVRRGDKKELTVSYRLRAFDPDELEARADHIRGVCDADPGGSLPVEVKQQYANLGPALEPFPELVAWAETAAEAEGYGVQRRPVRGGTGVDPLLERGIPVANLGTGYFAPESEKEFTSRQALARTVVWLTHLVQAIAIEE